MAKIYAELGIEIFDVSILKEIKEIFSKLGTCKQFTTKKNSIVLDFKTAEYETFDLEDVSDRLCTQIENADIVEELSLFYLKYKKSSYMDICFIFNTANDASIVLNERIISLANKLGVRISFDGI